MGIYRDRVVGITPGSEQLPSPERLIFGIKDNHLLVPLDLCLFEQGSNGVTKLIQPNQPGRFLGANVKGTGNVKIGVIADYSLPSVLGVNPIVKITPDRSLSFSPNLKKLDPITPGDVKKDDRVTFSMNGVRVAGKVKNPIPTELPYLTFDFRINAYEVEFEQKLIDIDSIHGARVFYPETEKTLGMLIGSSLDKTALVFPAYLV